MITPHKYLDLETCLLSVSAVILTKLRQAGVIKFDELSDYLAKTLGEDARVVLSPSLLFFYAVGLIEYQSPPIDGITLNETNQTLLQSEV